MKKFFSAYALLCALSFLATADVVAKTYKSHKIQVVVDPLNQAWNPVYSFYGANTTAGAMTYNFAAARDLATHSVTTGVIFPKGTVSKNQANYNVDKDGNALNLDNMLGIWEASEDILSAYTVTSSFPAYATVVSFSLWNYFFNSDKEKNNLFSTGRVKAAYYMPSTSQPAFYGRFDVDGGSGEFEEGSHNRPRVVNANIYYSTAGNMLIKIKFDEEIEVHY